MLPHIGAGVGAAASANKAVINTFINTTGANGAPAVQQASFSVDLEQIPGLIAKYEEARDKLMRTVRTAYDLQRVTAPGHDEVSKNMAKSLKEMASNQPGKLGWVVNKTIERLTAQIDQLKAAQSGYQATDEAAISRQV